MNEPKQKSSITFIKQGKENDPVTDGGVPYEPLEDAKASVKKLLSAKNVHFLFGAGASAPAIPVMSDLQDEFENTLSLDSDSKAKYQKIKKSLEDKRREGGAKINLEDIMGVLYSIKDAARVLSEVNSDEYVALAQKIKEFMVDKILKNKDSAESKKTLESYKNFYMKIAKRPHELSRVNIFTTNYDMFNEEALDLLNIDYINGFGGGLKRYFNPARFHYTFSKKVDPEIEKFEPIQSMVYLHKMHGSVNWIQSKENNDYQLFDLKEVSPSFCLKNMEQIMIYPTPQKSGMALNSPYSDLMAEMKSKLLLPNSVVFVIGYSFSDLHVNNIIYQALSVNSSLSIFIFGEEKGRLPKDDPRFYQLYEKAKGVSESKPLCHYFNHIVENLLPEPERDEEQIMLKAFIRGIKKISQEERE